MKILEPVFTKVIERLFHHKVEFMLIGGYAVNYHGYGRYTGDIDFWIKSDAENIKNFLRLFAELCPDETSIEIVKNLDFSIPQVIALGKPPLRIDFMTKVNLVDFEEAWPKRVFFPLENMQVPVVDYYHLVTMKMNTGRPKDKLDLDQLQRINQLNKKNRY